MFFYLTQLGQGINWDDLNSEKKFDTFKAYGQSKLAQIMFTVELEKILKGKELMSDIFKI